MPAANKNLIVESKELVEGSSNEISENGKKEPLTNEDLLMELEALLEEFGKKNNLVPQLIKAIIPLDVDEGLLESYKAVLLELDDENTGKGLKKFNELHEKLKAEAINLIQENKAEVNIDEVYSNKIIRIFEIFTQLTNIPDEKLNQIINVTIETLLPRDEDNSLKEKLLKLLIKKKNITPAMTFDELKLIPPQNDPSVISKDDLITEYTALNKEYTALNEDGLKKYFKKIEHASEEFKEKWAANEAIDTKHIYDWFSNKRIKKIECNNIDEVCEAIAVMDIANQLATGGHRLRPSQIMAIIVHMQSQDFGHISQVSTGEGKTTIVSFIQSLRILQGYSAHAITSNEVLAEDAIKERGNFYKILGISVAHNNSRSSKSALSAVYSSDIVYGSISNFQFDWLRHSVNDSNILGSNFSFEKVWVTLDEIDNLLIDDGEKVANLAYSFPGMDNLRYVYIEIWLALLAAEKEISINPENFFDEEINESNFLTTLKQEINKKIESFLDSPTLASICPTYVIRYAIENRIQWISNAIAAQYTYQEDVEYKIVSTSEEQKIIVPVDNRNTGVTLRNTNLANGLHQFLQLKHGLELTCERLTSSFISNTGFILKYKNKISGLTGTIGGISEQKLLESIYFVNFSIIPSYNQNGFKAYPHEVFPDDTFLEKIALKALWEVSGEHVGIEKKARSVLIICSSLSDVRKLEDAIAKEALLSNIKPKLRFYRDERDSFITASKIEPNEIILATNIAGRGADFKTAPELEANGGLHVIVSFLPCNQRVEAQAFGRTARQGNSGSAQVIIRESEVVDLSEVIDWPEVIASGMFSALEIKGIISARDKLEDFRLQKIGHKTINELYFKDALFECFLKMHAKLLSDGENNSGCDDVKASYLARDLNEQWAFWFRSQESKIRDVEEKKSLTKISIQEQAKKLFIQFSEKPSVQSVITKYCITHNPYYGIELAKEYLEEYTGGSIGKAKHELENALRINERATQPILFTAYIALFEVVMEQNSALVERYKKAFNQIFFMSAEKNENYVKEAQFYLELAEEGLEIECHYLHTLFQREDFDEIIYQSLYCKQQKDSSDIKPFRESLVSQFTCLDAYIKNVQSLIEQLKEQRQKEYGLFIGTKIPRHLNKLSNQSPAAKKLGQTIQKNTVIELEARGLSSIYELQQVHDVPEAVITSAQFQIFSGIALLTRASFIPVFLPIAGPLASALISEGIADIVIALIDQGHDEFNKKDYLKSKIISYGISIATLGISALVKSTFILAQAHKICRSLASKLNAVEGRFAAVCHKVAKNLSNLEGYFEKSMQLSKLSKLSQHQQYDFLVRLKETKNISTFQSLQKSVNNSATSVSYLQNAVVSATTDTLYSVVNEKIVIACLNRLLICLQPYIEVSVKKNLAAKFQEKELILNNYSRDDLEQCLEKLFDADLSEDIHDVVREISIGVMRHSNNWKMSFIALSAKAIITSIDIAACTDRISTKFFDNLPSSASENPSNKHEWLIDKISQPIVSIIYAKSLALVGETIVQLPKAFYTRRIKNQEKKNNRQRIKQINKRDDMLDHADAAWESMRCGHDAVGETLGINSRQLADAAGIMPSVHGADIDGIISLYRANGITTRLTNNIHTAVHNMNQCKSDRAVACFFGSDPMAGHAVGVNILDGRLVVGSDNNTPLKKYCLKNNFIYNHAQIIIPNALNQSTLKIIQQQINRNRIVKSANPVFTIRYEKEKIAYGTLGGSYQQVDKAHKGRLGVSEVNHVPPHDCYKGTPYENISYQNQPAMLMNYNHHRNSKGRVGAATSTGSSKDSQTYRQQLKIHLENGEYWKAVLIDCQDTLNTAVGNNQRNFYAQHIIKMLRYMKDEDIPNAPGIPGVSPRRLINQEQFNNIIYGLGVENFYHHFINKDFGGEGMVNYVNATPWNKYFSIGLERLLKLRINSVSDEPFNIQSFIWHNNLFSTVQITAAIISIPNLLKNTTLIPLSLLGKHWVGIIIEKQESTIKISYMDSERNRIPFLLKTMLLKQFSSIYREYDISFKEKLVELQKSNNCGPEVIENFISHITEGERIDQESVIAIHSLLLENSLINKEFSTRSRYKFWNSRSPILESESSVKPVIAMR